MKLKHELLFGGIAVVVIGGLAYYYFVANPSAPIQQTGPGSVMAKATGGDVGSVSSSLSSGAEGLKFQAGSDLTGTQWQDKQGNVGILWSDANGNIPTPSSGPATESLKGRAHF